MLDRLERIFGRLAVPNLALWLVVGQVFLVLARIAHLLQEEHLILVPAWVMRGEWWRPITFFFIEPITSRFLGVDYLGFVMMVFGWQLFYLMGSALEGYWGTFRFNAFIVCGYVLTIIAAFVTPQYAATNFYVSALVLLGFAYLNPDFELLLFFILPVRIKWIALVTVVLFVRDFVTRGLPGRLQIGAAVVTFLLFFGTQIFRGVKSSRRVATQRTERMKEQNEPRHVCHVCGKTDVTNPEMDFRYCSKCAGDQCYCPEHIQNHAHVVAPETEK